MAEMFDNTIKKDRVLLAAVDTGSYDVELSLDELEELTETAGGEVIARVTQKRPSFDSSTCIGSGRLEEMAEICRNENIDSFRLRTDSHADKKYRGRVRRFHYRQNYAHTGYLCSACDYS